MNNRMLISVVAIAAVAVLVVFSLSATGKVSAKDGFAKCLSEKGVVMYGASWCSHCTNQKKAFGSSWQFVTYVECATATGQSEACTDAGVLAYPTWFFSDGSKREGELTLQQLSQLSGCVLA